MPPEDPTEDFSERLWKSQKDQRSKVRDGPLGESLSVTEVPFVDAELVGKAGLTYLASLAFGGEEWESIVEGAGGAAAQSPGKTFTLSARR